MKLREQDIDDACSIRYLDQALTRSIPAGITKYCEQEFAKAGWKTSIKKPRVGALQKLSGMTTVGPCVIWYGYDWLEYSMNQKAAVNAHELVHIRQIQQLGYGKFAVRYANPRKRWICEMQAIRQEFLARARLGYSKAYFQERIELQAESFRNTYQIRRINFKNLQSATEELLHRWAFQEHSMLL